MKNIFEKLINKVLPFVLCICIVSGAAAPAYADTTTQSYNYYGITLGDGNTGLTNKNSADMLGYVLSVLSSNQEAIYNKISSSGGSDYSNVLSSILGHLSDINNKITAPVVNGTDKLFFIGDTLSYINRPVWSDGDNIAEQLQAYMSAMSYNLVSVYNKIDNVKTDTSNLSGIKTDTANLSGIKTDTANLSGIKSDTANIVDIKSLLNSNINTPWSYFYRYYDSQNNDNLPAVVTGNGLLNLGFYKVGSDATLRIQQSVSNYSSNPLQAIGVLNNNVVNMGSLIYGLYKYYPRREYNSSNNNLQETVTSSGNGRSYSLMDSLTYIHDDLLLPLAKLQFFIADDQSIQAKKANVNNENAFLNNFTGSGSASASPSDFGAVKDSMVSFKAGFSGGASSSDTFGFLNGDSNAWDWFTQDTANALDRTQGSNTRLLRGSSDVAYDTPLLDNYYNSILSILGGEH